MSVYGKYTLSKQEIEAVVPAGEGERWSLYDEWHDPFEHKNGPILCRDLEGDAASVTTPLEFGFRSQDDHCNVAGAVHGGWLLTFADVCMANSALRCLTLASPALQPGQGTPSLCTISLHMDFADRVGPGKWVTCAPEVYKRTKTHLFVRSLGKQGDRVLFSASASYRSFLIQAKL